MLLHTLSPRLAPLVEYLDSLTGPADLKTLTRLLRSVDVTRQDLGESVHFLTDGYARNRVALTEWYELVTLCWRAGQSSCIHDHAGAACAFRVIEGTGYEQRFAQREDGLVEPTTARVLTQGHICAAWDTDIHQIVNRSGCDLITLHIYTPPLEKWNTYKAVEESSLPA